MHVEVTQPCDSGNNFSCFPLFRANVSNCNTACMLKIYTAFALCLQWLTTTLPVSILVQNIAEYFCANCVLIICKTGELEYSEIKYVIIPKYHSLYRPLVAFRLLIYHPRPRDIYGLFPGPAGLQQ